MASGKHDWAALNRLLDTALSIAPEERASWLNSLGEEHAEVKDVLRELLARKDLRETGSFLATLPPVTAGASSPDATPGDLMGPYRLERQVGEGGMGSVWLAERADGMLRRKVALKLPHRVGAFTGLADWMGRERNILASLEHPNIARLYDAGLADDGRPYLALEYVEGEPIDRYCLNHSLDLAARLRLIVQVARAVAYAHAQLVVHRDLKPSNIHVDARGNVHLLDFGVAKLLTPDPDPAQSPLTQLVGRALTLQYASPEQVHAETVSTATDVYSLGVVLYELLTGKRPHQDHEGDPLALAQAIVTIDPERPSAVVAEAQLRKRLRGDLDTVVLKALKKTPAERYATVLELADDLERFLQDEPVRALPDSRWYRARKFAARNKLPLTIGVAALVAIVAGATIAFIEAHVADAQRDRAMAMSQRNEAVSQFLGMLITEAARSDRPVSVDELLQRSQALVKAEFNHNPEHQAAVLAMLATHYRNLGDQAKAEPLLHQALQLTASSGDASLRANLQCQYATVISKLGRVDEAKRNIERALGAAGIDTQEAAACLNQLAFIAQDMNEAGDALKYANLALQKLRTSPTPSPSLEAEILGSVGFGYYLNNRNDEADRYYAEAMRRFTELGRDRSPAAITVLNNWAIVSDAAGDVTHARELYERALQIVATDDPAAAPPAFLVANLARALELTGRYPQAESEYERCVQIAVKAGFAAAQAYCLIGHASVEHELGRLDEARSYLAQANNLIGGAVPTKSPAALASQIVQGRIALMEGRFDAAREAFNKVIDQAAAKSPRVVSLLGRAEANLAEKRVDAALADARSALEGAQSLQAGKPYSNRTGLAWLLIGEILREQGHDAEALQAFQSAVTHLSNTVDAGHPALQKARHNEESRGPH
jgi:serine/threonine-protein kinase